VTFSQPPVYDNGVIEFEERAVNSRIRGRVFGRKPSAGPRHGLSASIFPRVMEARNSGWCVLQSALPGASRFSRVMDLQNSGGP